MVRFACGSEDDGEHGVSENTALSQVVLAADEPAPGKFDLVNPVHVQLLVASAKRKCPDYMSPKYKLIQDMFGDQHTQQELKVIVDGLMLISRPKKIRVLDTHGSYALHRDPFNDKGDEGSILARQQCLERIGFIPGIRDGPMVRKHPVVKDHWNLLSGATMFAQGLRRAWEKDVQKLNGFIQAAVNGPIENAAEYHHDTNEAMATFLVEFNNLVNGEDTQTTIVQSWRSTGPTDKSWERKKKENGWSADFFGGQKVFNSRRLLFAKTLHPMRWAHVKFKGFEAASTFYRLAPGVPIKFNICGTAVLAEEAKTVWEDVTKACMTSVDLSSPNVSLAKHDDVFRQTNSIFRSLKRDHPCWVRPVLMLTMPTLEPLGKCALCPEGLNPGKSAVVMDKISDADIGILLSGMAGSETLKVLQVFKCCFNGLDQRMMKIRGGNAKVRLEKSFEKYDSEPKLVSYVFILHTAYKQAYR